MRKPTSDKVFFDTNILVYTLAAGDPRSEISRLLLENGGTTSVQVLNEFVAVARRKYNLTWAEIHRTLNAIELLLGEPAPIHVGTHRIAIELSEQHGYYIYDSLVIAAAIESSCTVLYSEDLHGGHKIQGLTIRNPFAS